MTEITGDERNERSYWSRHQQGESWKAIGWYPPIAGLPSSGRTDPEEAHEALRDLFIPVSVAGEIWASTTTLAEAIASGDLVQYPGAGTDGTVYASRAANEALAGGQTGDSALRIIQRDAHRALYGLHDIPSFTAFITGHATFRLAAIAAFRFDNGTTVPSGLGGTVKGSSVVLLLWSEVREPILAAARAYHQEQLGDGTAWTHENY